MSIQSIVDALSEALLDLIQVDVPVRTHAQELTMAVMAACGRPMIARLADGRWDGIIGFAQDAIEIPDDVVAEALGEIDDQERAYEKYNIVRAGLDHLVVRAGLCEMRKMPVSQEPDAQRVMPHQHSELFGCSTGGMTNEYRLREEVVQAIDVGELGVCLPLGVAMRC